MVSSELSELWLSMSENPSNRVSLKPPFNWSLYQDCDCNSRHVRGRYISRSFKSCVVDRITRIAAAILGILMPQLSSARFPLPLNNRLKIYHYHKCEFFIRSDLIFLSRKSSGSNARLSQLYIYGNQLFVAKTLQLDPLVSERTENDRRNQLKAVISTKILNVQTIKTTFLNGECTCPVSWRA
jgi:hypothetical protein